MTKKIVLVTITLLLNYVTECIKDKARHCKKKMVYVGIYVDIYVRIYVRSLRRISQTKNRGQKTFKSSCLSCFAVDISQRYECNFGRNKCSSSASCLLNSE